MRRRPTFRVIAAFAMIVIIAGLGLFIVTLGDTAKLSETASLGPSPTLPEPTKSLVPTVNIAYAEGWPEGGKPIPASGLEVNAFATGLDHPRWLYVLPNGDVLVAESNAPADRPEEGKGVKGKVYQEVQSLAGAGVPSADRITLLRDNSNGGTTKSVFLQGLHSPIGMALVGNDLYVANTDAIMRFPYAEGGTQITAPGVKIADLPGGPINHHWVKNVIASRDGTRLFATVGSNSNAAENGLDKEENRAVILEIDPSSGKSRLFASGMRNPNGLAFERALGRGERARRTGQRPRPGLSYLGEGGRLLRLAVQLLGTACRCARAGKSADGRQGDPARLRARQSRSPARPRLLPRQPVAAAIPRRCIHRRARVVEPQAAERLQGGLRAVRGRSSGRTAGRHPDRFRSGK